MKEVFIDVDQDGGIKVEAKGFSGKECKDLTEGLEQALGQVEDVKLKPEYRQQRTVARGTVSR